MMWGTQSMPPKKVMLRAIEPYKWVYLLFRYFGEEHLVRREVGLEGTRSAASVTHSDFPKATRNERPQKQPPVFTLRKSPTTSDLRIHINCAPVSFLFFLGHVFPFFREEEEKDERPAAHSKTNSVRVVYSVQPRPTLIFVSTSTAHQHFPFF